MHCCALVSQRKHECLRSLAWFVDVYILRCWLLQIGRFVVQQEELVDLREENALLKKQLAAGGCSA